VIRYAGFVLLTFVTVVRAAWAAEEADAPSPAGAPVVKLLEAGSGERHRLRYHLSGPTSELQTAEKKTTMVTAADGGPPGAPVTAPPLRMLFTFNARPGGPGELVCSVRLQEAGVPAGSGTEGRAAQRAGNQLGKLVGLAMDYKMTTRGEMFDMKTTLPEGAPPAAREIMEGMPSAMGRNTVFPVEPVGIGARWEIEQQLERNGLKVRQLTRCRLKKLQRGQVVLDVEVETTAGSQLVSPIGGGSATVVDSLHGKGTGTIAIDLGSVVPRRATIGFVSEVATRARSGEKTKASRERTTMEIVLRAGK
jgi:molybdopterin-binding protein